MLKKLLAGAGALALTAIAAVPPATAATIEASLGTADNPRWLVVTGHGWRNLRQFVVEVKLPGEPERTAVGEYWYACGKREYLSLMDDGLVDSDTVELSDKLRPGEHGLVTQRRGRIDAQVHTLTARSPVPAEARRDVMAALTLACARPAVGSPPELRAFLSSSGKVGFLQAKGFEVSGPVRRYWVREYPTREVALTVKPEFRTSFLEAGSPLEMSETVVSPNPTVMEKSEVNCARRTTGTLRRIEYSSDGSVFGSTNLDYARQSEVVPDSVGEMELDLVCLIQ